MPKALLDRPGADGGEVEEELSAKLIAEEDETAAGLQTLAGVTASSRVERS